LLGQLRGTVNNFLLIINELRSYSHPLHCLPLFYHILTIIGASAENGFASKEKRARAVTLFDRFGALKKSKKII